MKWKIQYQIKGDNNIKIEVADVHFDKKSDVKKWWLSKTSTFINCVHNTIIGGNRQDKEFINCHQIVS